MLEYGLSPVSSQGATSFPVLETRLVGARKTIEENFCGKNNLWCVGTVGSVSEQKRNQLNELDDWTERYKCMT